MTAMQPLQQRHIDWLLKSGVTTDAMVRPSAILWDGNGALYFQEDAAWWNVKTNQIIVRDGWWCIGEQFGDWRDEPLVIHATPLDWLKANRVGIVIIDWSRLFDELRDVPQVSVPASLREKYEKWMKPNRLPKVTVRG